MKLNSLSIKLFFFMSVFSPVLALAGPLGDQALDMAMSIRRSEASLSPEERIRISEQLGQIQDILRGNSSDSSLSCVANGTSFGDPIYSVYAAGLNKFIGDAVPLNVCNQLVKSRNLGLICAKNGTSFGDDIFQIFEIKTGKGIGDSVSQASCIETVNHARRDMVCAGKGTSFGDQVYALYNRVTGSWVGSSGPLSGCESSLSR